MLRYQKIILIVLATVCSVKLFPQTFYSAKLMTYNILDYQGTSSNDNSREDDLRMVIEYVEPDIIMAEEVHGTTGYSHFLDDVLNFNDADLYEGAFVDQSSSDIDIALYYKPAIFDVTSVTTIDITSNWGHRDALECVITHLATGEEFRLYGVHLKAGTGNDDESDREQEAENLRDYLNGLDYDAHFFVLGDFNFYNSDEGGFQRLTESQTENNGQLFDPIDEIGYWHNNNAFAEVHTQSPRGGNYGGMDDRFDFILASNSVLVYSSLNYVEESYVSVGNDGNHFNQAINYGSNDAVPDNVADALVDASDHLPVYLEMEFVSEVGADENIIVTEIMQNPSAVSDTYGEWFEIYNADSESYDLRNWTIRDNGSDIHTITGKFPVTIESGQYFVLGRNGDDSLNGGVEVDYDYSSITLGNSDDEIIILNGEGLEVCRVEYDGGPEFPDPTGASMALLDLESDINDGANWMESTTPYGDGDLGTPGEANWDVSVDDEESLPSEMILMTAHPNPFNPAATIRFQVPETSEIRLTVYDLMGREAKELVNSRVDRGEHEVVWNASEFPSGIYFCRLESGDVSQTQKLLLLK
ncbi:MAG: lamin tail domain-containing protein [Candidatus Marinimicrobia bacterium]|nr:lamin tail domain-containing protein [Candidatus Neomarinimicrobiota bacterium]